MFYETEYGLYGPRWKGVDPETVRHPAKFSHNLIYWIVQSGIDRGYWDVNTTIVDPFGGVGSGGLACADNSIQWVGVELEERFVETARRNFALRNELWTKQPIILQGDSRNIDSILGGLITGDVSVITSPPFSYPEAARKHENATGEVKAAGGRTPNVANQAGTHGNLATLPGILTSTSEMEDLMSGRGDTYWSAAIKIYTAVRDLMSENGVLAMVLKDFARDGKRIPLVDITQAVLEQVGFTTLGVTFAMQVSEDGTKEYKHFFRRDHERKGHIPRIDWECVLWMKKESLGSNVSVVTNAVASVR